MCIESNKFWSNFTILSGNLIILNEWHFFFNIRIMNYSDEKLRIFMKYSEFLRITKENNQKQSKFSLMTQNYYY